MRIEEIIHQMNMGGAERFCVDLCNELVSRGEDVTLIVTNPISQYGYFAQFLSEKVNLISMDKRSGADLKLYYKLYKLIKRLRPDVVHTHLGAIVYNLFAPMFYRKPGYVHTIHNTAEKEATTGGIITSLVRKFLFRFSGYVPVSISKESMKSYVNYYGYNSKGVEIDNGCPFVPINSSYAKEIYEAKSKGYTVLVNVARVQAQKNQLKLAKAVERLNQRYPIKLFIVGVYETEEGKELIEAKFENTVLLGPRQNPRDYMQAADAFILSSCYEGMPLTLIECFASGGFPIVTPVGGMVDMIFDGENGIIADGYDEESLYKIILRFLDMTDTERTRIRKNSQESFGSYNMHQCADSYYKLFKSLQ